MFWFSHTLVSVRTTASWICDENKFKAETLTVGPNGNLRYHILASPALNISMNKANSFIKAVIYMYDIHVLGVFVAAAWWLVVSNWYLMNNT